MIEKKGVTIGRFSSDLGIGESQAFNWLKADRPPPAKHWLKLCNYFGVSEPYLLNGISVGETVGVVAEHPAAHDGEGDTVEEIEHHHQSLLLAADGDPVRLGWIREQQRAHLAIPAHWQSQGSGITRVYDRAQKTALSTHTGLPVPSPSQRTRSA